MGGSWLPMKFNTDPLIISYCPLISLISPVRGREEPRQQYSISNDFEMFIEKWLEKWLEKKIILKTIKICNSQASFKMAFFRFKKSDHVMTTISWCGWCQFCSTAVAISSKVPTLRQILNLYDGFCICGTLVCNISWILSC